MKPTNQPSKRPNQPVTLATYPTLLNYFLVGKSRISNWWLPRSEFPFLYSSIIINFQAILLNCWSSNWHFNCQPFPRDWSLFPECFSTSKANPNKIQHQGTFWNCCIMCSRLPFPLSSSRLMTTTCSKGSSATTNRHFIWKHQSYSSVSNHLIATMDLLKPWGWCLPGS